MKIPTAIVLCAILVLPALSLRALPTETSTLFSGSGNCAFCHDSDGVALVDADGGDLSIARDWSPTMMGQSFRDPIFRAKLEQEVERTPHLRDVIEDKCLQCHAPMARTQAVWDGGTALSLGEAAGMALAADGVSCTLCHQIQPANLGQPGSFSAGFLIDDKREIYGPYADIFPNPMFNNTGYTPMHAAHVAQSALCGTCHTLFTPFVDDDGEVAGQFPEQTPYLEWLNSVYAAGAGAKSCQDCHMPRTDDPVLISSRPPGRLARQSPFWKHHFVGGNALVPRIMAAAGADMGTEVSPEQFHLAAARAEENLRGAARLGIVSAEGTSPLRVTVEVENLTGHKLPTGYPARRLWLHLEARDASGALLFESGAWDEQGAIIEELLPIGTHHQLITSPQQVQIYEAVMGDVNGDVTQTLLRAASYLKDNRLPPRGFGSAHPMAVHTAIIGAAADDPDFNRDASTEGTGTDRIVYEIPTGDQEGKVTVTVQLVYQTLGGPFLTDLLSGGGEEVERLRSLLLDAGSAPGTTVIAREARTVTFTQTAWAVN